MEATGSQVMTSVRPRHSRVISKSRPGRPFESRTHWPRRSRYAPPWKTGGYPHLHVLEHQRAAGKALEAHPLPVRHAEAGGVLRRHVNVALGHNQAAAQAEHPVPVAEGEARGALRIAGEAHRRGEPQGHRIGEEISTWLSGRSGPRITTFFKLP